MLPADVWEGTLPVALIAGVPAKLKPTLEIPPEVVVAVLKLNGNEPDGGCDEAGGLKLKFVPPAADVVVGAKLNPLLVTVAVDVGAKLMPPVPPVPPPEINKYIIVIFTMNNVKATSELQYKRDHVNLQAYLQVRTDCQLENPEQLLQT